VLLLNQKLDETVYVWCFPLEVALWVIGGSHIWLEEEQTRIGEWPVVGDGELLGRLRFDVFNDAFKVIVLANEFESSAGANAFDRIEVIAAEEDTEVDELAGG
jgi:hypothetical protein